MAIEAVGNVIEFWGFKRNQGRVWALLYLRGELYTAGEIERELDLSKGGVSMLLRDLERWGVVRRVRQPQDSVWRYSAETDLVRMVSRVIEEREAGLVSRIRADLAEAQRIAKQTAGLESERLERLEKMAMLAEHVEKALRLFIRTSRLDIGGVLSVLRDDTAVLRKKSR
jgi:DNA-binding transcriptional regulator GbsR (MarR family)